jgi:hypothetical protein
MDRQQPLTNVVVIYNDFDYFRYYITLIELHSEGKSKRYDRAIDLRSSMLKDVESWLSEEKKQTDNMVFKVNEILVEDKQKSIADILLD